MLVRLVPRDLLFELVDGPLQRTHRQFAHVIVLSRIVAKFVVAAFQTLKFGACVGPFNVVLQAHGMTSIMPLGTPIRSVPKVTFTYSSKSACATSFNSRNGRPAMSSDSATTSVGNPLPISRTQS